MILDSTESKFQRFVKNFLSQPHQPFFILGISFAVYAVMVTTVSLWLGLDINIRFFHALNMLLFMSESFFLGFLITVIYRFLGEVPFLQSVYMRIFYFLLASAIVSNIAILANLQILFLLGMLLLLIASTLAVSQFVRTYKNSKMMDKFEPFWIITLFSTSTVSACLFAASVFYPDILSFAIYFSFYIFVIGVVYFVAQRMLPAFFSVNFGVEIWPRPKWLSLGVVVVLCSIAIAKTLNLTLLLVLLNGIGAMLAFALFFKSGMFSRLAPPIMAILQIGIAWFVLGFVAGIVESIYSIELLQIHVFGVGFLGTLVVGFGTRVTLGHSGQQIHADRVTIAIFALFQLTIVVRLASLVAPQLLVSSGVMWCAVLIAWSWRYLPSLLRL